MANPNPYAAELGRILRSPFTTTSERIMTLQALAVHHEVRQLREALDPRRCKCGALDSANHQVTCRSEATWRGSR